MDTPITIPEPGLSADEIADYEELRSIFSPTAGLKLLDDFAKWLFGLSGSVGTLAAGFGVSGANHLSGSGRSMFAAAIASVAFSLALATLSRLPLPFKVNRYSPASMRRALTRVFALRAGLLLVAALFFAAGLALAGCAQLLS